MNRSDSESIRRSKGRSDSAKLRGTYSRSRILIKESQHNYSKFFFTKGMKQPLPSQTSGSSSTSNEQLSKSLLLRKSMPLRPLFNPKIGNQNQLPNATELFDKAQVDDSDCPFEKFGGTKCGVSQFKDQSSETLKSDKFYLIVSDNEANDVFPSRHTEFLKKSGSIKSN
jgi:hypothetical protein